MGTENGKDNGTSRLVVGGCVSAIIIVLLALFSFSYQKSSQAFETSVQNRERISVIETKFEYIRESIDENRRSLDGLVKTVNELSGDVRSVLEHVK